MEQLGVVEAAARLGLSPHRVRDLIRSGDLPARRLAGRWVVDPADIDRLAEDRSPGRPLSPRVAWGLISLIEAGDAPDLSPPERSRLRARLRAAPRLDQLARLCRRRARPQFLHIHPGALPRVVAWDRAVAAGASAAGHEVLDARRAEIYLPEEELRSLRRALRARPADGDANVLVRVPSGARWPFPNGVAGPVTVALDLWEAGDSRSRRAAERLYRRALAGGRFEARSR